MSADRFDGPDSTGLRVAEVEGIVTPEAVVLELETAGIASRLVAALLDLLIQGVLLSILAQVALAVSATSDSSRQTLAAFLVAFVLIAYPVLFETFVRGRTPGKMAVGLRAVTLEGGPVRLRHAMLRMMGGIADKLMPPGGVTGLLFVLGTRRHQRIGDLIAGTIVIRDPPRTAFPAALWFPVPWGLEEYAATMDPSAITVEQYTLIRSYLVRSRELSSLAREELGRDLADRVAATMHHQRRWDVPVEAYLLCAIARYQRRSFPAYQPAAWQAPGDAESRRR